MSTTYSHNHCTCNVYFSYLKESNHMTSLFPWATRCFLHQHHQLNTSTQAQAAHREMHTEAVWRKQRIRYFGWVPMKIESYRVICDTRVTVAIWCKLLIQGILTCRFPEGRGLIFFLTKFDTGAYSNWHFWGVVYRVDLKNIRAL